MQARRAAKTPIHGIQSWILGFINTVGTEEAKYLLNGAGELIPLHPQDNVSDVLTTVDEDDDDHIVVHPECYVYPYDFKEVRNKYHPPKEKEQKENEEG